MVRSVRLVSGFIDYGRIIFLILLSIPASLEYLAVHDKHSFMASQTFCCPFSHLSSFFPSLEFPFFLFDAFI